jgi:hypothetical protein
MNAILKWLRAGARRTLIGSVFVICALLPAFTSGCSRAAHYRENHDAKSLCATLNRQVKPGDSMEKIEKLLDAHVLDGALRQQAARHYVNVTQSRPKEFPDGVVGDDVFVGCPAGDSMLFLQFRQGKLINFDPERFKTVPAAVSEASEAP